MADTGNTRTIQGEIVLPSDDLPAGTADLIVQVEDVSRTDVPSVVVAEQRQSGVSLSRGAVLPSTVEVPEELVDERRSYSVRVHVDVSGSGEVSVGDLVSTQSYPVLTHGYGNEVRVGVRRV